LHVNQHGIVPGIVLKAGDEIKEFKELLAVLVFPTSVKKFIDSEFIVYLRIVSHDE
jgi:hypothetical protein